MKKFSLKSNQISVASIAGAALLVALVAALSFWAFSQIETSSAARNQTYSLIVRTDALLNDLSEADAGQLRYLLTGNEAFLAPYVAVRDRIGSQLVELRPIASSSAARGHLDAMSSIATAKLAHLSYAIELRRSQEMTALLAAESREQGKRLMDSFRAEVRGLVRIEEGTLAQQDAEIQSSMKPLEGMEGAIIVDLENAGRAMTGAIVPRGGQYYFYKLMGGPPAVSAAREAFVGYVKAKP